MAVEFLKSAISSSSQVSFHVESVGNVEKIRELSFIETPLKAMNNDKLPGIKSIVIKKDKIIVYTASFGGFFPKEADPILIDDNQLNQVIELIVKEKITLTDGCGNNLIDGRIYFQV